MSATPSRKLSKRKRILEPNDILEVPNEQPTSREASGKVYLHILHV